MRLEINLYLFGLKTFIFEKLFPADLNSPANVLKILAIIEIYWPVHVRNLEEMIAKTEAGPENPQKAV